MTRVFIIALILIFGCGKKGKLYLDKKDSQRESIINEERVYKF